MGQIVTVVREWDCGQDVPDVLEVLVLGGPGAEELPHLASESWLDIGYDPDVDDCGLDVKIGTFSRRWDANAGVWR